MITKELKDRLESLMWNGVLLNEETGRRFFTGYKYRTLYDWDQYFEGILQLYMGWSTEYLANAVLIFLDDMKPDGFIRRCINMEMQTYSEQEYKEMVKPFLAQITLLCYKKDGHVNWLGEFYYKKLQKYLEYWMVTCDYNGDGLSVWNSSLHTGLDNQHERAGVWKSYYCEGIDLNCYIYRECESMALLAEVLGRKGDAARYRALAQLRKEAVLTLWDEEQGCFLDRDERNGQKIQTKTIAMFMPMWAGIATGEQVKSLVERWLTNPDEFWRNYPVPALPASEPGYSPCSLEGNIGCCWRANTWVVTNYMIMHGLMKYGYRELAEIIEQKTMALIEKSGDREYYTTEEGTGCGMNPFWGWSLLGYFMRDELDAEKDIMDLNLERIL